ncbi:MAG: hypothetical protein ACHQM6_10195 [Candidatus Kapaibacterium sp.]
MKQLFLIISLIIAAGRLNAQSIAKNEPVPSDLTASLAAPPGVAESSGYKVVFLQNKKNYSFEILSPKSDKADVKLTNTSGMDICTIYKGVIHEGKNVFTLPGKKIACGTYYVVSKLASGEQFADRVVISK